jgi:tetrahydromethanopterin S-methyltransferase subunit G
MKISEAISLLKNTEIISNKKSVIKSHKEFIAILRELDSKELTLDELNLTEQSLQNLLSDVNFKDSPQKIYHKKQLFKKFLVNKLSLVTSGYYTSLGIALGLCFGIPFGAMIEKFIGASIGMTIGMLIGIVIGKSLDSKAELEGRVLKTV